MFRLHSSAVVVLLACTVLAGGVAAEQPAPGPLAHFTFNGHPNSEVDAQADWDLRNTSFKDDSLFLNGIYEFGPDGPKGYHAVCSTPGFRYTAFTATIRFKAEEFAPSKTNLLTGGTAQRWFGLEVSPQGNLTVTFNNGEFQPEIANAPLKAGQWTVVSCAVDLAARKVAAYVDGKQVADLELPAGFKLKVIGSPQENKDKVWSFVNYSNTNLFHGLVDELIIHNRFLTATEIEREFQKIPLRQSKVKAKVGEGAGFLTKTEQDLLDRVNRERFKAGLPPYKVSRQLTDAARGHAANMARQGVINHTLDGKRFDQRIDATGYRSSAAGENIWNAPTAAGAMEGWMGSPGHRGNILSKMFREIGVGAGVSPSKQKYWTLVFGTPLNRPQQPPAARQKSE